MNSETPTIASTSYASSYFSLTDAGTASALRGSVGSQNEYSEIEDKGKLQYMFLAKGQIPQRTNEQEVVVMSNPARRIVKVFIVDPDENVPLGQALLYQGPEKMTEATDQELFFEVDIKTILDKHNEVRKAIVNKKVKERTEYLEPTRIRDLKMTVVQIAIF